MNDDQFLLANAYLDGELTDDERGIAEADPDVMAEVEQLRALQASMRAVEPPTPEARHTAIGLAMAEFGHITAPVVISPIPFRPRPAYARYLGVAAAVVAVGLLAVVVTRAGGGDDSSSEPAAPVAEDAAARTESADSDQGNLTESVLAADDAAGGAAEVTAEVTADQSGEATTAEIAAAPAADSAVSEESDNTLRTQYDRPDIDPDQPLIDELELGAFGTYLLEQQSAGRLGATPNTSCPPEFNILAETIYVLDGVDTAVYVAVQPDRAVVLALDTETCVVIVEGPLF